MVPWATNDVITAANLNAMMSPGMVLAYGGSSAPSGWLLCNGAAVSRTTYSDLFAILSTTFGVGDGSTTFNVPNFMGRTVLGAGAGAGLTLRACGDIGGSETHALTAAELATHAHSYNRNASAGSGPLAAGSQGGLIGDTTGAVGSGSPHNNVQPFGVANYIIKT